MPSAVRVIDDIGQLGASGFATGNLPYWDGTALAKSTGLTWGSNRLSFGTLADGVTERVRIAGQGAVNYHIVTGTATFNSVVDGILMIGANVADDAGGLIDPSYPSAAWYIEDRYRYTPTNTVSEFYMGFFNTDGTERRPVMGVVDWTTNNSIVMITGAVTINSSASQTAYVQIPDGGGIYQTGQALRIDHSQQLDLRNADAASILQVTASGAGADASFKIASPGGYNNDLVLGVAGADWVRLYGAANGLRIYKPAFQFQAGAAVTIETVDAYDLQIGSGADIVLLDRTQVNIASYSNAQWITGSASTSTPPLLVRNANFSGAYSAELAFSYDSSGDFTIKTTTANDITINRGGVDYMRFYGAVNGVRFYKPVWQFQAGAETTMETADANDLVFGRNSAEVVRLTSTALRIAATKNLTIGSGASQSTGAGIAIITDATTLPSTNPTTGALLYSEGGVIKTRDGSGNITSLGPRQQGEIADTGNTNATVITTQSTFTRIGELGSLQAGGLQFDSSQAGRLRYTGAKTRTFLVIGSISFKNVNTNVLDTKLCIYKNGTVNGNNEYTGGTQVTASENQTRTGANNSQSHSLAVFAFISLAQNDYIELAINNTTNTNDYVVVNLNLCAVGFGAGTD